MLRSRLLSLLALIVCPAPGCMLDRTPRASDDVYTYGEGLEGAAGTGMEMGLDDPLGDVEQADAAIATMADPGQMDVAAADEDLITGDMGNAVDPMQDGEDAAPVVDPPRYVGACTNDRDCALDETCVKSQDLLGTASYCAAACQVDGDCAAGPAGSPAPACAKAADGKGQCHLPCDALVASTCPDTMMCRDTLVFLSSGSCVFGG